MAALGLKEGIAKSLQWTHNDECLKPGQLDGMEVENDLSQSALLLTVPQAYLEYTSSDWDPPSRWDDGIPGLIADYSLNAQNPSSGAGRGSHDISGNGTVGANLGHGVSALTGKVIISTPAATTTKTMTAVNSTTSKNWDWSRYYCLAGLTLFKSQAVAG